MLGVIFLIQNAIRNLWVSHICVFASKSQDSNKLKEFLIYEIMFIPGPLGVL